MTTAHFFRRTINYQTHRQLHMASKTHSNQYWSSYFLPTDKQITDAPSLAIVLLNTSLDAWNIQSIGNVECHAKNLFLKLWQHAKIKVCADGGANRLYDLCSKYGVASEFIPNFIKGDLDSLRQDVRDFYTNYSTQIIQDPDQDTNDLDKCMQLLKSHQVNQDKFHVIIFGSMGGRFDQTIQNINTLFRWQSTFNRILLLSEASTVELLEPNITHIIRPNLTFETRTCGLLPIAGPCEFTTTKGLKWNLSETDMRFGGMISSSNHIESPEGIIEVVSSHPLLWTTEIIHQE